MHGNDSVQSFKKRTLRVNSTAFTNSISSSIPRSIHEHRSFSISNPRFLKFALTLFVLQFIVYMYFSMSQTAFHTHPYFMIFICTLVHNIVLLAGLKPGRANFFWADFQLRKFFLNNFRLDN